MRAEGLEPPRAFAHRLLSHATGARAPYLRDASRSWSALRRSLRVRCYPICYPPRRVPCAPGRAARAAEWRHVGATTDAAEAPRPTMRSRLLRHAKEASGRASPRLLLLVPSDSSGPGLPHARLASNAAVLDTHREMPEESTTPDLVELVRQWLRRLEPPRLGRGDELLCARRRVYVARDRRVRGSRRYTWLQRRLARLIRGDDREVRGGPRPRQRSHVRRDRARAVVRLAAAWMFDCASHPSPSGRTA